MSVAVESQLEVQGIFDQSTKIQENSPRNQSLGDTLGTQLISDVIEITPIVSDVITTSCEQNNLKLTKLNPVIVNLQSIVSRIFHRSQRTTQLMEEEGLDVGEMREACHAIDLHLTMAVSSGQKPNLTYDFMEPMYALAKALGKLDDNRKKLIHEVNVLCTLYEPLVECPMLQQPLSITLNHLSIFMDGQEAISSDVEEAKLCVGRLIHEREQCHPILRRHSAYQLACLYLADSTPESCIKAAGLFNYALRLPLSTDGSITNNSCSAMLAQTHERLLSHFDITSNLSGDKLQVTDQENLQKLEAIREKIEQEFQNKQLNPEQTRQLFDSIADKMKGFIAELLRQSTRLCGAPPCPYALIALGSLARHEATPYSDLEFAFLVQEMTPEVREYFIKVTYLMHLKVVNLGETILPSLAIKELGTDFFDDVIQRGFAFDGGGVAGKGHKTPLGQREQRIGNTFRAHEFELIQTPEGMAQFQGMSEKYDGQYWFQLEPHLPMELHNAEYVAGDPTLVATYAKALVEALDEKYENATIREYLAFDLLVDEDLVNFNPWLDRHVAGSLLQVKQDLYRLLHLTLERWALFLKINPIKYPTSWKKIDQLVKKGKLSEDQAARLRWLLSETMRLRLEVYCQSERQRDLLCPFTEGMAPDMRYASVAPDSLEALTGIYQTLLPVYGSIIQFINSKNLNFLPNHSFFSETENDLGEIKFRLGQIEAAEQHFLKAIQDGECEPSSYLYLFYIALERADWAQANEWISGYGSTSRHHNSLTSSPAEEARSNWMLTLIPRVMRARLDYCRGETTKAYTQYLMIADQLVDAWPAVQHPYFHDLVINIAMELTITEVQVNPLSDLTLLKKCLKAAKSAGLRSSILSTLSVLVGNQEGADYYQQAKVVEKHLFPSNHPRCAELLLVLASRYLVQKQWNEVEKCCQQASNILKLSEQQSDWRLQAGLLMILGAAQSGCGRHQEAQDCYKDVLALLEQKAVDESEKTLLYCLQGLDSFANTDREDRLQEANRYYSKALKSLDQISSHDGMVFHQMQPFLMLKAAIQVGLGTTELSAIKKATDDLVKINASVEGLIQRVQSMKQEGDLQLKEILASALRSRLFSLALSQSISVKSDKKQLEVFNDICTELDQLANSRLGQPLQTIMDSLCCVFEDGIDQLTPVLDLMKLLYSEADLANELLLACAKTAKPRV